MPCTCSGFQYRDLADENSCHVRLIGCTYSERGCLGCESNTNREQIDYKCVCIFPYKEYGTTCVCTEPYYLTANGSCVCIAQVDSSKFVMKTN